MHSLGHNQTPILVDLLLITGLWLVNHDVMQLNIEIDQPQLESGCARRTQLLRKVCLHFTLFQCILLMHWYIQELSSCWDGRPFGHNRHGPKVRRGCCGGLGPHL